MRLLKDSNANAWLKPKAAPNRLDFTQTLEGPHWPASILLKVTLE